MITIQQEFVDDVWHGLVPLLHAHWNEVGMKVSPLLPNKNLYAKSEENGLYVLYTMRVKGKLAGYAGFFLTPSIHEMRTEMACCDVIYVSPEYRGFKSIYFFKQIEKMLTEESPMVITFGSKSTQPIDRLLERLGYGNTERVFTKILESANV